jgi:hypothetical protein
VKHKTPLELVELGIDNRLVDRSDDFFEEEEEEAEDRLELFPSEMQPLLDRERRASPRMMAQSKQTHNRNCQMKPQKKQAGETKAAGSPFFLFSLFLFPSKSMLSSGKKYSSRRRLEPSTLRSFRDRVGEKGGRRETMNVWYKWVKINAGGREKKREREIEMNWIEKRREKERRGRKKTRFQ